MASPATPTTWNWLAPEPPPQDFIRDHFVTREDFPAAHRQAVERALIYAREQPDFQALVPDLGSLFLSCATIYMHYSGGLTHRRLRNLTGGNMISAGRATALLWRLRLGNFIEVGAPARRGAVRHFVPTATMHDGLRQRLRIELEAVSLLDPALIPLVDRFEETEVFAAFMRALGDDVIVSGAHHYPALDAFFKIAGRTHACLIVYALLEDVKDQRVFPPHGESTISVTALASRFGLARSHVRRVIGLLQGEGLIRVTLDGRILNPALSDTLRLMQGVIFSNYLRAGHRALKALAG